MSWSPALSIICLNSEHSNSVRLRHVQICDKFSYFQTDILHFYVNVCYRRSNSAWFSTGTLLFIPDTSWNWEIAVNSFHFKLQPVYCWKLDEAELILNSPSTQHEFFFSFVLQCSTEENHLFFFHFMWKWLIALRKSRNL